MTNFKYSEELVTGDTVVVDGRTVTVANVYRVPGYDNTPFRVTFTDGTGMSYLDDQQVLLAG